MPVTDRFRSQCRLLRIASLVVFTGLALLFALGLIGPPVWAPSASGEAGTLVALAVVRFLLGDLAAGRLFHAAVARAMRHIGFGVLAGSLLNVFVVTNLLRVIGGGQGGYLYFDISGIVLGVVGAALVMLARLVDQARALQAELDDIF